MINFNHITKIKKINLNKLIRFNINKMNNHQNYKINIFENQFNIQQQNFKPIRMNNIYKFSTNKPQKQPQQQKLKNQKNSSQQQKQLPSSSQRSLLFNLKKVRQKLYELAQKQIQFQKSQIPKQQLQHAIKYLSSYKFNIKRYHQPNAWYKLKKQKNNTTLIQFYRRGQYKKIKIQDADKKSIKDKLTQQSIYEETDHCEVKILMTADRQLDQQEEQILRYQVQLNQDLNLMSILDKQKVFIENLNVNDNKQQEKIRKGFQSFKIAGKSFTLQYDMKSRQKSQTPQLKTRTNSNGIYKGVVVFIRSSKLAKKFESMNSNKNNTNKNNKDNKMDTNTQKSSQNLQNETQSSQSQTQQKWIKIQLFTQKWIAMHLYRISIVSNLQQYLASAPNVVQDCDQYSITPYKYPGVECKQLPSQILSLFHEYLIQQNINGNLLGICYYYSCLYEQTHYMKWLNQISEIVKV